MVRKWLGVEKVMDEIKAILHLPLVERLLHHKARRTLLSFGAGAAMVLAGSLIAVNKVQIAEFLRAHDLLIDCSSGLLHDIGAIPIIRYFEPFWTLLAGEQA